MFNFPSSLLKHVVNFTSSLNKSVLLIDLTYNTGLFNMPPKRLLAHYKIDPERNSLVMLSCNAEDMLLARCNFTFYG
jgi:hypothetical protein